MKYVLASALISITACGASDPLEPGSGDQLGTGTQTLLVKGPGHRHVCDVASHAAR